MVAAAGAKGLALVEGHLGVLAQPLRGLGVITNRGVPEIEPKQVSCLRNGGFQPRYVLWQLLDEPIAGLP